MQAIRFVETSTTVSIWILLLLLSGTYTTVHAQKSHTLLLIDSLKDRLKNVSNDSTRTRLLDNISFAYYTTNPDSGIFYAKKTLVLARKLDWQQLVGNAYNDMGNSLLQKGNLNLATDQFFKALAIHATLENEEGIGNASSNIAQIYGIQSDFAKAHQYLSQSLVAYKKANDYVSQLTTLGNIGNIYFAESKYAEALDNMQQALSLATDLKDNRSIINQRLNIGSIYAAMQDYEASKPYFDQSLSLAKNIGDVQMQALSQGNLGDLYLSWAMDTAKQKNVVPKKQLLQLAVSYLKAGLEGSKLVSFSQGSMTYLELLSKAYKEQGDFQKAFSAYSDYISLRDSTQSNNNKALLAKLETQREVQLKDKDIKIAELEVIKKRNERWAYIIGILVLLGVLGLLYRSFKKQRYSNVLLTREKRRSDELLLNILPEEVAEELKRDGKSAARQYNDVSVLFTDFVNFTGISEQLSPTALVQELHLRFSAFDKICEEYGLEKIKTIGDAYMAVCGLPVAHPDHALRTVKAALAIQHYMNTKNYDSDSHFKGFELRMGISSGSAVAGIVGINKFAFDIWSDTVNTAARMEQNGEAGKINVSESTYQLLKGDFHCVSRGMIEVKNKGAIAMYFVEEEQ